MGEYAVSPSGTAAPGQTQVYRVLAPDMAPELIVHAFYCFPRPHVPLVVSTRCTDVCGSPSVSRVTVNSRKQGGQGLTVIADCTELRPSPPPRISCARGCRVVASSGLAIADLIVIMRGGLVYSLHCDAQLTGLTVSHIFTLIKLERCQRAWNNV